jgi:hypothetical protein
MSDLTVTDGLSVLGRCLREIRSLAPEQTAAPDERARDFFGSPFRALGIDAPYLEARALPPHPRQGEPAVAFPPLEGSPDGAAPFQLFDWEVVAQMRKSGVHDIPHSLLAYLELLRCIASPLAGSGGIRMPRGVCRPYVLPQEYFREDPDEPCNYKRATRVLRRSFLALYGHVLLRCLAARNEEWVAFIFDCPDCDERMRRLKAELLRNTSADEERWAAVSAAAVLFVGSNTFRQLYLGTQRRRRVPQIHSRGAGARTHLFHTIYEEEFGRAREMMLPAPLALCLHMTLDDRNETGTLALFPKALQEHAYVLCDEQRIERAERMLWADEHASWFPVRFTRQELSQGTTKPSSLYTSHASFCVILERLLATDSVLEGGIHCAAPENPTVQNSDGTAAEGELALQRQIDSLGEEIARHGKTRRSRPDEARGSRFRESEPAVFEFSTDGFATLTLPQRQRIGQPLICTVQREAVGLLDAGTIWVPVPRHLVRGKLRVELHVLRFDFAQGQPGWRMTALPASVTDYFIVDAGVLLCLELERDIDEALPAGLPEAIFHTRASMRMTGVPGEEDWASLSCVIACFE